MSIPDSFNILGRNHNSTPTITELPYCSSDGKAYIDLEIKLDSTWKYQLAIGNISKSLVGIFGARNDYSNKNISVGNDMIHTNTLLFSDFAYNTTNRLGGLNYYYNDSKYIFKMNNTKMYFYENQILKKETDPYILKSNFTTEYNGYLFKINGSSGSQISDNTFIDKFYYLKIYDSDDNLIHHYVAILDLDKKIKVYDKIKNKVFTPINGNLEYNTLTNSYCKSDGNAYIDLGIKLQYNWKYQMSIGQITDLTKTYGIFGVRTDYKTKNVSIGYQANSTNGLFCDMGSNLSRYSINDEYKLTKNLFIFNFNKSYKECWIDSVVSGLYNIAEVADYQTDYNGCIFKVNNDFIVGAKNFVDKFYYLRIYDNDNKLIHYYMYFKENGIIKIKDKITNEILEPINGSLIK